MNEKAHPVLWKHEIRRTWKIAPVKAKPVAELVSKASHDELGLGVGGAHCAHHAASGLGGDDIHVVGDRHTCATYNRLKGGMNLSALLISSFLPQPAS